MIRKLPWKFLHSPQESAITYMGAIRAKVAGALVDLLLSFIVWLFKIKDTGQDIPVTTIPEFAPDFLIDSDISALSPESSNESALVKRDQ